jgi:DNA mismatch repair protein MSH3
VQSLADDEDDEDDIVPLYDEPPPAKKARTSTGTAGSTSAAAEARKKAMAGTQSSYFGKKTTFSSNEPSQAVASSSTLPAKVVAPKSRPSTQAVNLASYRLPRTVLPPPSQSGSAFDNYTVTLDPASAGEGSQRQPKTAEQEARHERWQARVLGPGGIRPRRRSLALDEAAAAEARGQVAGDGEGEEGDGEGGAAGGGLVVPDGEEAKGSDDERQKSASGVGSKLAAKFAAKTKEDTKTKGKGKGKKKEEVGPSGQTYTPLEKQFMEIKAENQDVLLLMEVGYKYKYARQYAR